MTALSSLRLNGKAIVGAAVGPVARGSSQIVTFVLTLVAMRYIDPNQFGSFALAVIAITVIRTLLYTGAFEFLLKASDVREAASEALCINMMIAVGSSLTVGVISLISYHYELGEHVAYLVLLLLPSNLISAVGAWQESQLLRSGRITSYYTATFVAELMSMFVAVAMFVLGYGVYALIVQIYARNLLISAFYSLISLPKFSTEFSKSKLQEMSLWAAPIYGSSILGLLSNYSADILLGLFLSPAATGLYRASNRLVTAVTDVINQPTRLIALTLSSRKVAQGGDATTLWTTIVAISGMFGWSFLAGLAVTAHLLVPALLGADWQAAAPIAALLCIARAFSIFDSAVAPALVVQNHQHALLRAQTVATIALLVLVSIAAPWGLLAATIATIVAAALKSLMMLGLAARLMPGSVQSLMYFLPTAVAPALVITLVATIVAAVADEIFFQDLYKILLVIGCGASAWIICLVLLKRQLAAILEALRQQQSTPQSTSL